MGQIPTRLTSACSHPPRGLLVVPVYFPPAEWEVFFPALVEALVASGLQVSVRVVGDGNPPSWRTRIDACVEGVRQRFPDRVRPTRHREGNGGKGAAVYFGWEGAEEEWLGFVDGDGAIAPEEVVRLARIAFADTQQRSLVIASRQPWSGLPVKRPWHRQILNRLFSLLVRFGTGLRVHDSQCGMKWVPASGYAVARAQLREYRFVFDVDLLVQLHRAGLAIHEVPVPWWDASRSTVRLWRDGPAMLWGLARVIIAGWFGPR